MNASEILSRGTLSMIAALDQGPYDVKQIIKRVEELPSDHGELLFTVLEDVGASGHRAVEAKLSQIHMFLSGWDHTTPRQWRDEWTTLRMSADPEWNEHVRLCEKFNRKKWRKK